MCDTPRSLKECCIDYICEDIFAICSLQSHGDLVWRVLSTNDEFYLPSVIAEQLVDGLSVKGKMDDSTLRLFDSKFTQLRNVRLRNASRLTRCSLRTLRSHRISKLEVTGIIHMTINDLISCLGNWTVQNLQTLNVANTAFVDSKNILEPLSRLHNLRSLNVSNTEFNDYELQIAARDLTLLENLDISRTEVYDISPLLQCKNRLKSLSMANVETSSSTTDVICELRCLQQLDISNDIRYDFDDFFEDPQIRVEKLLKCSSDLIPLLSSLDISGIEKIRTEDLRNFLVQHPKICFLGLVHPRAKCSYDAMFTDSTHDLFKTNLVVAGTANESQILETLRRYPNRVPLYQMALMDVFELTQDYEEPRVDVIRLVFPGMEAHPKNEDLQLNALACLYRLCRERFCQKIHPRWLKRVAELSVTTMENFPTKDRIHKNALAILVRKRILETVTFGAYRYVRVVLESLCTFNDASITRKSTYICATLIVKMSPEETSRIGTQTRYLKKLLFIVASKMQMKIADSTLEYPLNALWHLTDDSPDTCRAFLNEGGLDLYLKLIEKFKSLTTIANNVVALMLNIAEFKEVRQALMTENLLVAIRSLVKCSKTEFSYFAAGIVAYLVNDENCVWNLPTVSRAEMLSNVEMAVMSWQTPTSGFISCNSLKPFFPLLLCYEMTEAQLWAACAVHHVCLLHTKRYCPMLLEEGGVKILYEMTSHPQINKKMKEISRQILDIVRKEGLLFNFNVSSR